MYTYVKRDTRSNSICKGYIGTYIVDEDMKYFKPITRIIPPQILRLRFVIFTRRLCGYYMDGRTSVVCEYLYQLVRN